MQTLIIGDLHFVDKPPGLLEAQKNAVLKICEEADHCDTIVFLGDLMMHRHPRPAVLLALKEVFDTIQHKHVFVLRGNHDSVSKADDGVTALSLFENERWSTNIITHTYTDHKRRMVFIPHYEDEQIIKEALANVPEGYTVFGHFGYHGVLNSAGDADFGLALSDFKNPTILGHIHKEGTNGNVSVLGTPYTINFGDRSKDCYYGILDDEYPRSTSSSTGSFNLKKIPSTWGPRHIVMDYEDVEDNLDFINDDGEYGYTLLRININTVSEDQEDIAALCNKITAPFVQVRYKPLLDERDEFETDDRVFTTAINDELFDHYINQSNAKINKDELLGGLKLIHEHQQDRNN